MEVRSYRTDRLQVRQQVLGDFRKASVLAEGEREGLYARIEKLDFELSIGDGLRLPYQLVYPLFGDRANALFVNVNSAGRGRRLPIDQNAKFHECSWRWRSHD